MLRCKRSTCLRLQKPAMTEIVLSWYCIDLNFEVEDPVDLTSKSSYMYTCTREVSTLSLKLMLVSRPWQLVARSSYDGHFLSERATVHHVTSIWIVLASPMHLGQCKMRAKADQCTWLRLCEHIAPDSYHQVSKKRLLAKSRSITRKPENPKPTKKAQRLGGPSSPHLHRRSPQKLASPKTNSNH